MNFKRNIHNFGLAALFFAFTVGAALIGLQLGK